jgi:hypothetical protein
MDTKAIIKIGKLLEMEGKDRLYHARGMVVDYSDIDHMGYWRPFHFNHDGSPREVMLYGQLVCNQCAFRWMAIHPYYVSGVWCPVCAGLSGFPRETHDAEVAALEESGMTECYEFDNTGDALLEGDTVLGHVEAISERVLGVSKQDE